MGTMSTKIMYMAIAIAIGTGIINFVLTWQQQSQVAPKVACTAEALQCPDGSYVGRSGPNCQFVCPPATTSPTGV